MELVLFSAPKKINPFVKKIVLPFLAICSILLLVFFLSDSTIKAQLIKSTVSENEVNEALRIQEFDLKSNSILGLSEENYENKTLENTIITNNNLESNLSLQLQYSDKRVDVLREYFKNMSSPLSDTEVPELSVKYADEFGLNKWSLIAAISKIESAGCKYMPGFVKFNCWGYGNGGSAAWENFDQVVRAMSKRFSTVDSNPTQVVKWYCPPCANPDHPQRDIANQNWDKVVIDEMQKINNIAKKYGVNEVDIYSRN